MTASRIIPISLTCDLKPGYVDLSRTFAPRIMSINSNDAAATRELPRLQTKGRADAACAMIDRKQDYPAWCRYFLRRDFTE